ncbi:collagen alpha-1(I) chain-like [Hyaena hyaena]|uniref:collagen alpha-1(I) chain-like n=1 Tax=Hyaena hyaena TaxID=95912 RepID=UPI0019231695|nr:collagen alpha-1(I) chain-like [Hyaena hyaena]
MTKTSLDLHKPQPRSTVPGAQKDLNTIKLTYRACSTCPETGRYQPWRGKGHGVRRARAGPLQLRPHPRASPRAPRVRKGTIADPRSPEPSRISRLHLPPGSSKFSVEPGQAQKRGPGGGGGARGHQAGGTRRRLAAPQDALQGWPFIPARASPPAREGRWGTGRSKARSQLGRVVLPLQTVGAGGGPGSRGGTLTAPALSRSTGRAVPRRSPRHKGGRRAGSPLRAEPPDPRRGALTPSRRRRRQLPARAGCAAPPAASPGKRGRRACFLRGFLRRGPSSSPAAGVSGRRGSRAGPAGRGQPQHHHVAARRRPPPTWIQPEREGRCSPLPSPSTPRGPKFRESDFSHRREARIRSSGLAGVTAHTHQVARENCGSEALLCPGGRRNLPPELRGASGGASSARGPGCSQGGSYPPAPRPPAASFASPAGQNRHLNLNGLFCNSWDFRALHLLVKLRLLFHTPLSC